MAVKCNPILLLFGSNVLTLLIRSHSEKRVSWNQITKLYFRTAAKNE
jgi:hypothetical protein